MHTSDLIDEVAFPLRYFYRLVSNKGMDDAYEGPKKTSKDLKSTARPSGGLRGRQAEREDIWFLMRLRV